jgi:hypothetical protein
VVVDGLYQCAGCSLVFTDPQAFTKLMQDSIVNMRGIAIDGRHVSIRLTR